MIYGDIALTMVATSLILSFILTLISISIVILTLTLTLALPWPYIQFNSVSIQFICIAQFHKLQICLGVLYNLYT